MVNGRYKSRDGRKCKWETIKAYSRAFVSYVFAVDEGRSHRGGNGISRSRGGCRQKCGQQSRSSLILHP